MKQITNLLIDCGIPAVVAINIDEQNEDDMLAEEFITHFYENILSGNCIEKSFMKA